MGNHIKFIVMVTNVSQKDRLTNTLLKVIIVAAVFYLLFTFVALLRHQWNPLWFVWEGTHFSQNDLSGNTGYDGQFVYAIAQKGLDAAPNLDNPPYRLQRIFLPWLIGVISFHNPILVPWNILLVNFMAILGTVYVMGKWLRQHNTSVWYALTYGLYVGTLMAYSRDVTEPLAYFLAACGLFLWLTKRPFAAVVLFAFAALTKEQTMLFPIGLALAELFQFHWKRIFILGLTAVPLLIWEAYLYFVFGQIPLTSGPSVLLFPLWGILSQLSLDPGRLSGLLFVAIPAVLLLGIAIYLIVQNRRMSLAWLLLIQAVFVILLPLDVYEHLMHVGRNAGGLVVTAVFIFPWLNHWWRRGFSLAWIAPSFIWLIPILRWSPWT